MGSGSTVKNKVGCQGNGFTCFTKQKCYHVLSIHYVAIVVLFSFFYWKFQVLYNTDVTFNANIIYNTNIIYNSSIYIFYINNYRAYITLQIPNTNIKSLQFTNTVLSSTFHLT